MTDRQTDGQMDQTGRWLDGRTDRQTGSQEDRTQTTHHVAIYTAPCQHLWCKICFWFINRSSECRPPCHSITLHYPKQVPQPLTHTVSHRVYQIHLHHIDKLPLLEFFQLLIKNISHVSNTNFLQHMLHTVHNCVDLQQSTCMIPKGGHMVTSRKNLSEHTRPSIFLFVNSNPTS